MANHRIIEATNHRHLPYSLLHGLSNPSHGFIIQEGSSTFDFGELEEAIVLQGVEFRNTEAKPQGGDTGRGAGATTLEMFPSWPIRAHQTPPRGSSKTRGDVTDSGSANFSSKAQSLPPESPMNSKKPSPAISSELRRHHLMLQYDNNNNYDNIDNTTTNNTGNSRHGLPSTSHTQTPPKSAEEKKQATTSGKQLEAKTLRRLAQNREAARKSRLRKKAYVQQLESSKIKLTQLEQELQRSRSQGQLLGGWGPAGTNIASGTAIFDMEYARWLEEDNRHMLEIRTGLQAHLSDNDLRLIVDSYISHFDEIFRLKAVAVESDVFHLVTGTWMSPVERCFTWIGGFRPSDLIKMLVSQFDMLTEQQLMGIYNLQHSSQQAEDALSQGLEQLQQSLIDTIVGGHIGDTMQQMALAVCKLSNLEGLIRQADNLRQQTIHQLRRILTVRQSARCFLIIAEYYGRLRTLSSLWLSRSREGLLSDEASCQTTADLQVVLPLRNHFSNF